MVVTRILHTPADVGGHAFGLSRGERELGLRSDVAVFSPGPFGYGTDVDLRAGVDHALPVRIARRAAFLRQALERYDVFHFNFGQTLLTLRQFGLAFDELPLLKRRGKKVIVTYQGCDVRPFGACACRNLRCVAESPARQPRAARLTAFADRVLYLNPDLRRWLPTGRFVPYANVDPKEFAPEPLPGGDEIVVAHAPTDREVKGTRHVVEAIETLRAEGSPVRLDLIEGLPRAQARQRLLAASVVVDQLLMGWYGGFAVEAMSLGRPVISSVRDEKPGDNPFGDELPIVRSSPATILRDLRVLLEDGSLRRELGAAGRRFVERHHDPRAVARRVLDGLVSIPERRSGAAAAAP
jgi:glycosyltransferase involved in cell wall biosynthesis